MQAKFKISLFIVLLLCFCFGCASKSGSVQSAADVSQEGTLGVSSKSGIPDNRAGEDFDELWGVRVADPYRWLEDVKGSGVSEWMSAQDSRARDFLSSLPERDVIARDIKGLMEVEAIGVPVARGDRLFVFRRAAGAEKSVLYLEVPGEEPRVLLDPLAFNPDGSTSIGTVSISPDGSLLAYALKENNADHSTMYLMDTASGETRASDVIRGARYAHPSWLPDGSGFYYTKFPMDESIPTDLRPGMTEVYFHRIGSEDADDVLGVGALNDPTKFHQIEVSHDGEWLIYTIDHGWSGNEVKIRRRSGEEWLALPVRADTHYWPQIADGILYLHTNEDAPRFKVMAVDLIGDVDLSRAKWREIVAESENDVIESFSIFGGHLVVSVLRDVVNYLKIYDRAGGLKYEPSMPSLGSLSSLSGRVEDSRIYFSFQSYDVAPLIYLFNTGDGLLSEWAKTETRADVSGVVTEQKWAVSKDGTRVPYFVVRKKDVELTGKAPTILYGYGGFNVSITPVFRPGIYAWLERGGIYVYSNLRGGSEFGEDWHRAGMRLLKQNVFDDYAAVAESLIAEGYTSRKHLAIYGGSNGGLLVGAAMVQHPDLYGAVVCAVPLLDMVRYHLFGSGRTWISEYGSVEESESLFQAIYAYSPYSHVKSGVAYPPVLFLGADSDDRVDPMHTRKMAAILQDRSTRGGDVYLRIEKNAGHGGADLVSQRIAQDADMYAFLLRYLSGDR